jgi:hypothetical protein
LNVRRRKLWLGAWLAILSAAVVVQGLADSKYSYDMVFYIGSAIGIDAAPSRVHALTFDALQRHLPASRFREVIEKSTYRARIYADPQAFADNLAFYRVRPLYVGLIRALHELGANYVLACNLISAVSAGVLLWLFTWTAPGASVVTRPILAPLLAMALGLVNVGRMAMPDALSGLRFFAAALFVLSRRTAPALLLLVVNIAVRSDNVIFAGMLASYLWLLAPKDQRISTGRFALTAAAATALYFTITNLAGNHGWSTVFHHSFVEKLTRMDGPVAVSFAEYRTAFTTGATNAFGFQGFLLAAILFAMVWLFRGRLREHASPVVLDLALLSGAYVALHFALFPVTWYRFFVCQYLLIALAGLHLIDEPLARWRPSLRVSDESAPESREDDRPRPKLGSIGPTALALPGSSV